jgi:hypothetical protein
MPCTLDDSNAGAAKSITVFWLIQSIQSKEFMIKSEMAPFFCLLGRRASLSSYWVFAILDLK